MVGTVKKYIAAMVSRWFLRKASHRRVDSESLGDSLHPAGNRSLGNIKPEHEKLAMDSRCSPARILGGHRKDQISNLLRNSFLARRFPDSGDYAPIQTEARSVPP